MPRAQTAATPHQARESRTHTLFQELLVTRAQSERELLTREIAQLNLPLCTAVASRFFGRGNDRDDLIQVARVGLLLVIRRYRPGRGPAFASFAVPTISGELKRHFRDQCWIVRPPRSIQELHPRVVDSRRVLEQELGHPPTLAEIARHLGVEVGRVTACMGAPTGFHPISPDSATHPDSSVRLIETLPAEDVVDHLIDRIWLDRAVQSLPAQDRLLIRLRFVESLSQTQIASRLGVSQMQVSRQLRRVLRLLRSRLHEPEGQAA